MSMVNTESEMRAGLQPQNYGLLVEDQIKALGLIQLPAGGIDEPRCFKHASYDLRLGHEFVLPGVVGQNKGQLEIGRCDKTGLLAIPSYGSAIVSTYETINLPSNVAGRFDLRIRHALEGLIVQMGTQIEPGYKGPLYALLHNTSDQPRVLKYGDYESRPFTIEFQFTSVPSRPPPKKPRQTIRDFIPPQYARGGVNLVLEKINEVQAQFTTWKFLAISSTFMGIMILLISLLMPFAMRFAFETYGPGNSEINSRGRTPFPSPSDLAEALGRKINENSDRLVQSTVAALLVANAGRRLPEADLRLIEEIAARLESYRNTLLRARARREEAQAVQVQITRLRELLNQQRRQP
jgi:deoxycytidine triphosphate deaminase